MQQKYINVEYQIKCRSFVAPAIFFDIFQIVDQIFVLSLSILTDIGHCTDGEQYCSAVSLYYIHRVQVRGQLW